MMLTKYVNRSIRHGLAQARAKKIAIPRRTESRCKACGVTNLKRI